MLPHVMFRPGLLDGIVARPVYSYPLSSISLFFFNLARVLESAAKHGTEG